MRCVASRSVLSSTVCNSLQISSRSFMGPPDSMANLVLGTLKKKLPVVDQSVGENSHLELQRLSLGSKPVDFALPERGTQVYGENAVAAQLNGHARDKCLVGVYECNRCSKELFQLDFDRTAATSSLGRHLSGWPSFLTPIETDAVSLSTSESLSALRIKDSNTKNIAKEGDINQDGEGFAIPQTSVRISSQRSESVFRADSESLQNAVGTPIESSKEINRWAKHVAFHTFEDDYQKREHDTKVKIAKRLWKSSRGEAGHNSRLFIGCCGQCKEQVCFVTLPKSSSPLYIVSAEKVHCVAKSKK